MNSQNANHESGCSRHKIIAYLDGDLSSRDEIVLETHCAVCKSCAEELNEQKRLLCALDFALDQNDAEFEVPEDFAKVVVASAESNVQGLRKPQERFRALFVCAALFLMVLVGFGKEAGSFVSDSENIVGRSFAFSGYAFQFLHDIGVGVAVVLRCLSQRFVFSSAVPLAVLLVFFALISFVLMHLLAKQYRS